MSRRRRRRRTGYVLTRTKNLGLDELLEHVDLLRGAEIVVRARGDYPDGRPVALVARVHEHDTGWIAKVLRRVRKQVRQSTAGLLAGRSVVLDLVDLAEIIEDEYRDGVSTHGLVDTGRLRRSISARVEKG